MLSLSDDCSSSQRSYGSASLLLLGVRRESSKFRQVNMAALSLSARKGDNRPAHEKQAPDFTVRYVVAECCHYQRSTVVVLERLAIHFRGLLSFG